MNKRIFFRACLVLVMFFLTACQQNTLEFLDQSDEEKNILMHLPRFASFSYRDIDLTIVPITQDVFVVLNHANFSPEGLFSEEVSVEFLFTALNWQLDFWKISGDSIWSNVNESSAQIGQKVYAWNQQAINTFAIVGELENFFLMQSLTGVDPEIVGQPIFNFQGSIIGVIQSFDMEAQQFRVLKYSVVRDFWQDNKSE